MRQEVRSHTIALLLAYKRDKTDQARSFLFVPKFAILFTCFKTRVGIENRHTLLGDIRGNATGWC
jgi:hypothetical protein